jgi:hypothetical protein
MWGKLEIVIRFDPRLYQQSRCRRIVAAGPRPHVFDSLQRHRSWSMLNFVCEDRLRRKTKYSKGEIIFPNLKPLQVSSISVHLHFAISRICLWCSGYSIVLNYRRFSTSIELLSQYKAEIWCSDSYTRIQIRTNSESLSNKIPPITLCTMKVHPSLVTWIIEW